ncbi:MAG: adenylate/guanylate cyclase domain-containing protein, partial [Pseudomonadota bacterium]
MISDISAAEIAEEFRIEEALTVVATTPRACTAFVIGYLILGLWLGPGFLWGWTAIPTAVIALVMGLGLVRFFRLRGRPRPERVSKQMIVRVIIGSSLMGVAYGAFAWMMFEGRSLAEQLILIITVIVAAQNSVTMSFWNSLCYSIPSIVLSWMGAVWMGVLDWLAATTIFGAILVIMLQAIFSRRRQTLEGIALSLRNRKALASVERLSGQLSRYISPELYDQIVAGKAEVRVAAERKRLTVFFSDLVSFTEITDRLEPEEITALLNDYLTEMSAIAREHGACFDKFMGDGMLFYFGDPETKGAKEDASACVRMGIAMQRRLRELNTVWAEQGMERPLRLRIGIHTGFCTVGNFGSAERMDYTIIGGTVNQAARLEFHCEPGGILMSHTTHALVS